MYHLEVIVTMFRQMGMHDASPPGGVYQAPPPESVNNWERFKCLLPRKDPEGQRGAGALCMGASKGVPLEYGQNLDMWKSGGDRLLTGHYLNKDRRWESPGPVWGHQTFLCLERRVELGGELGSGNGEFCMLG